MCINRIDCDNVWLQDDPGLNRTIVRRILERVFPSKSCLFEADDGTTAFSVF